MFEIVNGFLYVHSDITFLIDSLEGRKQKRDNIFDWHRTFDQPMIK